MRSSALLIIGIAFVPALGGCSLLTGGRPDAPFRITTDHASYMPGQVIGVTILNVSVGEATYNICQQTLQRRVADRWETLVRYPVGGVCTMEAHFLRSGESVEVSVHLSSDFPIGPYRIVFPGLGESSLPDDARATPSFVVATEPALPIP
jgi:hypothetical protein